MFKTDHGLIGSQMLDPSSRLTAFQTYGAGGLIDRLPAAKAPHPNRVAAEIEQAILEHALAHPCHGPLRVAQELVLRGLQQRRAADLRGTPRQDRGRSFR